MKRKIVIIILLILICVPLISLGTVVLNKNKSYKNRASWGENGNVATTVPTNEREKIIEEFRQLMEENGLTYSSRQEFKEAVLAAGGKNIDNASIEELKEMVNSAKKTREEQKTLGAQFNDIITENEIKYKNIIYNRYFNKKGSYIDNKVTNNYNTSSQVYNFNNEEKIAFKMCYCALDKEKGKVTKMAFWFTVYGSASCYNSFTSNYSQGEGEIAVDVLFDVESGLMYPQGAIYGFNGVAVGEQKGDRGFNYGYSLDEISDEELYAVCNYEQGNKFVYFTNE